MDNKLFEKCCELFDLDIEDSTEEELEEIKEELKKMNDKEEVLFNLMHYYNIEEEKEEMVKRDLPLFKAIEELDYYDSNTSNYEFYFLVTTSDQS